MNFQLFKSVQSLHYWLSLLQQIFFSVHDNFVHLVTPQHDSSEGPTHKYNLRSRNNSASSLTYTRNQNKNLKDQSSNFFWRVVNSIWTTSVERVASSIILKIDLQDYMASSHMHHIKLHHPIMSQSCVYKWHTHVMCDELQSTHTQKDLLHLSYIPRDWDYNTSHNTCGINEFPPLYIDNGYKGYNCRFFTSF